MSSLYYLNSATLDLAHFPRGFLFVLIVEEENVLEKFTVCDFGKVSNWDFQLISTEALGTFS